MTSRARVFGFLLVLALAVVSAGCQHMQLDPSKLLDAAKDFGKASREATPEEEAQIGKEWAAVLVGAAPLLNDPAAQRYVNQVGRWVSLQSERPDLDWKFGILDDPDFNAFAAPGGYVFVTKGLLIKLRSESELAGVLGHEISHVVKKHHLVALRKSSFMQGLGNLAESAKGGTTSQAVTQRIVSGAKEMITHGLDKDDELEADRMGVVLAARSGYDPYGLPAVLQRLQGMDPKDSGVALLFSTHPAPGTRLDKLEPVMAKLDRYGTQPQLPDRFSRVATRIK
jgi:predicted Zn-dependent protease